MNLRARANRVTLRINPNVTVVIRKSTGFTQDSSMKRTPSYAADLSVLAQVQSLTFDDLRQIDGLNLQGEKRAVYLDGNYIATSRVNQTGGDIVVLPDSSKWLSVQATESWGEWTKLIIVRQLNP